MQTRRFLRSEQSLIQTIGRAARNSQGKGLLPTELRTRCAIDETNRRRFKSTIGEQHYTEQSLSPSSNLITASEADYFKVPVEIEDIEDYSPANIEATITRLEVEMRGAAKRFEFEKAAELRDRIKVLRDRELQLS